MIQTSFSQAYFNPRPPRGGRRKGRFTYIAYEVFQSTPSARRATCPFCQRLECLKISIHALREEGDSAATSPANPRKKFQSTPSARRATASCDFQVRHLVISIHALREEGDADNKAVLLERFCISIHALREEGDSKFTVVCPRQKNISIHALREEGDWF